MTPPEIRARLSELGALPAFDDLCVRYRVSPARVLGRDREHWVVLARHHIWTLLRNSLEMSYPEIGRVFGVDHTTVMVAVRRMNERANAEYAEAAQ